MGLVLGVGPGASSGVGLGGARAGERRTAASLASTADPLVENMKLCVRWLLCSYDAVGLAAVDLVAARAAAKAA